MDSLTRKLKLKTVLNKLKNGDVVQASEEITANFREKFYSLVKQIPRGKVTTYGLLAEALGDKRAARAVGRMLNQNPNLIKTPCHRVIKSNGELGGYKQGKDKKKELLKGEGLRISENKVQDFKQKLYDNFTSEKPLKKLREIQLNLREKITTETEINRTRYVSGIDVSYERKENRDIGYAALYIKNEETEKEHSITHKGEIPFPYIPTYLSFRELPIMANTIKKGREELGIEPDVLLVDGNGILHPFRFGLASELGLKTDLPTIGVAKSKLCGEIRGKLNHQNQSCPLEVDHEKVGYAYLNNKKVKNPVYISPGHKINPDYSLKIVKNNSQYKIPQPIRKSHMNANRIRKRNKD